MPPPVAGTWRRQFVAPSGAQVWGTGVNQVHYYYGSDPLRLRNYPTREGEQTPAWAGVPDQLEAKELWGYQCEDSTYTGLVLDDRPHWGEDTPDFRRDTGNQPSWAAPGSITENFRQRFGGAYRNFRGTTKTQSTISYQIPSETVSEGWRNKPKGSPADSKPSDDSQLTRQTSMQQRYRTRNNNAAVSRGTDESRAEISSKVTGQRIKVYSGGERHYDMFPFQQDQMPRPFYYRTAGVGRIREMLPNTLYSIAPLQRIPPADPSLGQAETALQNEYGYTSEDTQYYA